MRYLLALLLIWSTVSPQVLLAEKKKAKESKKRFPLGWEEKVQVTPGPIVLHAKLDTGHLGSAIYAQNIERFKRKKESWVKFTLEDRYGHKTTLERKILRRATLKSAGNRQRTEYVVEIGLCLGGKYFEDEIRLSDRGGFAHELRLGRQSLEGHFFVDPSMSYTTQPACPGTTSKKVDKKK
jgi:hypothetical protein